MKRIIPFIIAAFAACACAGTKVTLDENGVMVIDGHPTFVISVSLPPLPGAKTPTGRDALAQLKEDGLTLMRIRPTTGSQRDGEDDLRSIRQWLDAAAAQHLYCWVTLSKLPAILPDQPQRERLLRMAIDLYKDHPALAAWKGFDEAAWVKMPPEPLLKAYQLIKQLDP